MTFNPGILLALAAVALVGLLMVAFSTEERPSQEELRIEAEKLVAQYPPCTADGAQPVSTGNISHDSKKLYFSAYELSKIGVECNPSEVALAAEMKAGELQVLSEPDETPSIDTPQFEPVWTADQWLGDDALVLTLIYDKVVRAYPVAILNWHEVVNDWVGGTPLVIAFCPLCQGGFAYERPVIDGKVAEFGTSGRIYQTTPVLYDRVTGSFWELLDGQPIAGSLVGMIESVKGVPLGLSRWGDWKIEHPDSEVLSRPTTATALGGQAPRDTPARARLLPRNYGYNPYLHYLADQNDTFGMAFSDRRLPAKLEVTGISLGGQARAYSRQAVERLGLLNDNLGGVPLLVVWNPQTRDASIFSRRVGDQTLEFKLLDGELVDTGTNSLWSFDGVAMEGPFAGSGAQLQPLPWVTLYWFAWVAAYPDTDLWDE